MYEIKVDLSGERQETSPMTSGSIWIDESKVTHVTSIKFTKEAIKHLGVYLPGWYFNAGIGGISLSFSYVHEKSCNSWHAALLKFVR